MGGACQDLITLSGESSGPGRTVDEQGDGGRLGVRSLLNNVLPDLKLVLLNAASAVLLLFFPPAWTELIKPSSALTFDQCYL